MSAESVKNNHIKLPYVQLGLRLCVITFVAAALLGLVNMLTADRIAELTAKADMDAMKALIASDNDRYAKLEYTGKNNQVLGVYMAENGGSISGYCVKVVTKGYGGDVRMIVGVGADLKVIGVVIVSADAETPGLGQKITEPSFRAQYEGKSHEINSVKGVAGENEIVAVTGATISSRAVTLGVNLAIEAAAEAAGGVK